MSDDQGVPLDGGRQAPAATGPRDRRDDGRPEQTRPRDRTGRPLPYGTSGVPLTEDHEPEDVEQALALGIELWDQQRFFESHECLEHVWHAAPPDDADLWQGVIQVAVAGVHLQRGNPSGARTLLDRAAQRLSGYPDTHRGIDVAGALRGCRELLAALEVCTDTSVLIIGRFPATADGVWFTPDLVASESPWDTI